VANEEDKENIKNYFLQNRRIDLIEGEDIDEILRHKVDLDEFEIPNFGKKHNWESKSP